MLGLTPVLTNTIIHNSKAWAKWLLHIQTLAKARTRIHMRDLFPRRWILLGRVCCLVIAHTWTYDHVGCTNTCNQGNVGSVGFANLSFCSLEKSQPTFRAWIGEQAVRMHSHVFVEIGMWLWNSPKTTPIPAWPVNSEAHHQPFNNSQ